MLTSGKTWNARLYPQQWTSIREATLWPTNGQIEFLILAWIVIASSAISIAFRTPPRARTGVIKIMAAVAKRGVHAIKRNANADQPKRFCKVTREKYAPERARQHTVRLFTRLFAVGAVREREEHKCPSLVTYVSSTRHTSLCSIGW